MKNRMRYLTSTAMIIVLFQNCSKGPTATVYQGTASGNEGSTSRSSTADPSSLGTNSPSTSATPNASSGAPSITSTSTGGATTVTPTTPIVAKSLTDSFELNGTIFFLDQSQWYAFNVSQGKFLSPSDVGAKDNRISTAWGTDSNSPQNLVDIRLSFPLGDSIFFLDSTKWYSFSKTKGRFIAPEELSATLHDRLIETVWGADPNAPPKASYAKLTISFKLGDVMFLLDDLKWYAYSTTKGKFLSVQELNPNLPNRFIASVWGDVDGAPQPNAAGNYSDLTTAFNLGDDLYILNHTSWFKFDTVKGEFLKGSSAATDRQLSTVWGGLANAPQSY